MAFYPIADKFSLKGNQVNYRLNHILCVKFFYNSNGRSSTFSFASCDKEEEPANPNPYSVRFGYIRGTINGTAFCLQNKEAPGETYITNGNIYTEYPKLGINSYGTNIPITKDQNEFVYGLYSISYL